MKEERFNIVRILNKCNNKNNRIDSNPCECRITKFTFVFVIFCSFSNCAYIWWHLYSNKINVLYCFYIKLRTKCNSSWIIAIAYIFFCVYIYTFWNIRIIYFDMIIFFRFNFVNTMIIYIYIFLILNITIITPFKLNNTFKKFLKFFLYYIKDIYITYTFKNIKYE